VKETGSALAFVTRTESREFVPSSIDPKSRAGGLKVRGGAVAIARSEMNSSEVLESETSSRAAAWMPEVVGVEVTVRVQFAPGATVAQLSCAVKSDVVSSPLTWSATVPVFESVTVWEIERLPTAVEGKLSELWESR
jgi:hypothetical protein